MNTQKITNAGMWIARSILVASFIAFVTLTVAVAKQNKKIKEYKEAVAYQREIIAGQNETINRLWGEECVTVNVTCNITQKGLVTINQANQISKSVATYTRGQMLMAIDSIHRANDTITKQ